MNQGREKYIRQFSELPAEVSLFLLILEKLLLFSEARAPNGSFR